jgi:large subunit ribosomal protein L10
MNREEKAALVEEIAGEIKDAAAIFAVDYRGISVPQGAELRAKLRDADARFRIVKNRLTLLAADRAGAEELKGWLEGPTALTFVKGDAVLAAKALHTFGREHEILEFKGGVMEGEALDADQFKTIARLPGLDVLHGQLAGMVASPVVGLARGLGWFFLGLASQLKQIEEQGLVSGLAEPEAETVTEEPPTEEPPAEEPPAEEPPAEEPPAEEPPAAGEPAEEPVQEQTETETEEEGSDGD